MADTNWGTLAEVPLRVWMRDVWKMTRNMSMINAFAGRGINSMVQRITTLTETSRGTQAVMHLVADLVGDGAMNDTQMEDNEEAINAYDKVVNIGMMRQANRDAGRFSNMKTVVRFREQSRDLLSYWLADRIDQLGFLTMSGITYNFTNKGANRYAVDPGAGRKFTDLPFAADVSAPTANRGFRWNATASALAARNVGAVAATDTLSYEALVRLKAQAHDQYIRGIRGRGNNEMYHVFVTETALADLKLDPDYLANVRNAAPRSNSNPLFEGTESIMLDGLMLHSYRHVFNTKAATTGTSANVGANFYKWGANANIDGCRVLLCGAQALGFADVGAPSWDEDTFDYKNKHGVSISKMLGFVKPKFHSIYTGAVEDFAIMTMDVATS